MTHPLKFIMLTISIEIDDDEEIFLESKEKISTYATTSTQEIKMQTRNNNTANCIVKEFDDLG